MVTKAIYGNKVTDGDATNKVIGASKDALEILFLFLALDSVSKYLSTFQCISLQSPRR